MAPKYALSDSESESEADAPNAPSETKLEKTLRDEVAARWKAGKQEELTVKRVRLAVEQELKLEEGFFKTGDWKEKSAEIIRNEVILSMKDKQENAGEDIETEPAEEPAPPPQPKKKAAPKRTKSDAAPKPRKRQKTQTPHSDDEKPVASENNSEEEVSEPKKQSAPPAKKSKSKPVKEASPESSDAPEEKAESAEPSAEATKDDSESEVSVVIDEEPPKPAPTKRKSAEGPTKEKKKPTSKGKDEDTDPDQAEIKRLQGWLVKCGIRKMWWRELQPYDTPKAKIKHLKQMLEDAGMKGRYSLEKARQIRDERELKDDLEQIQQGAKQWGTGSGDEHEGESGDTGPPKRRAARGRQALAFLESDGEETD
ncbi:hypothetical protein N7532_001795 [Penicillium argentinense]|uniref:Transcriptional regulator n=1 Tax=Penicillium argentinense TaxID=1131581 RepID=A0A9W9G440_9EURO|nr:uncharacterized protein N7532_001795 [Penicillium argentinense]KAJ5111260.1 hypothetical protein N7532_001795 [Penicillium argentinense]